MEWFKQHQQKADFIITFFAKKVEGIWAGFENEPILYERIRLALTEPIYAPTLPREKPFSETPKIRPKSTALYFFFSLFSLSCYPLQRSIQFSLSILSNGFCYPLLQNNLRGISDPDFLCDDVGSTQKHKE